MRISTLNDLPTQLWRTACPNCKKKELDLQLRCFERVWVLSIRNTRLGSAKKYLSTLSKEVYHEGVHVYA